MTLLDTNDFGWVEVDDTGLSELDAYGLLSAVESERTSAFTSSAAPPVHTGAMIALIPSASDLERLAVEGGEALEELHLTLAYLGEADQIDEETRSRIIDAAGQYFTDAVATEAFSVNAFNPHNPDMETALVLGVKGEDLVGPRSNAVSAVRGFFAMPDNHEPWLPHVTLAYSDDVSQTADFVGRLGPIKFDTLRFAFGDEVHDIPLFSEDAEEPEVLTAGVSRMPLHLKRYWLGPEGSARVGGWGNEGSYTKCVVEMRKEGVPPREVHGLCANLYHAATGHTPNQEKAMTAAVEPCPEGFTRLEDGTCGEDGVDPSFAEWEGVLTVEGKESGDGRMFSLGSLDWAEPPIKLMYQPANTGGHSGSIVVGQITGLARRNEKIYGWGVIDLKAKTAEGFAIGQEVHRLMGSKLMNGVSVDVDKVKDADVSLIFGNGDGMKPTMTVFQRGRVRGATLVAFPAFVEAEIFLTGGVVTASAIGTVLATGEEDCGCAPAVLTAASHTITIPDVPPAWWFSQPTDVELHGALTITDEGRVYGLLAPGGVTHRSVKRQVPRNVDYSRFMGKETLVAGADGQIGRVKSGAITFNCGHASTKVEEYGTLDNRMKHYDNSCSVFADIVIGQDRDDNVWIGGAVKSYATAEQISQAMSCSLSGDWQPHPDRPGVNEFIAALLVPVPGFAMARKEASVRLENGALVSSAVPVEYAESDESAGLLLAAAGKRNIFAQRLGVDVKSRKIEFAKRIGRD